MTNYKDNDFGPSIPFNDWGRCPVPDGAIVKVRSAYGGWWKPRPSDLVDWHDRGDYRITEYQVLKEKPVSET